jgi:hypothetical protein
MDYLFKKHFMPVGKGTMSVFRKGVVVPSMMRRPLIGAGGAGVRKMY